MGSVTEELNFSFFLFCFVLILKNLNVDSHTWLMTIVG